MRTTEEVLKTYGTLKGVMVAVLNGQASETIGPTRRSVDDAWEMKWARVRTGVEGRR